MYTKARLKYVQNILKCVKKIQFLSVMGMKWLLRDFTIIGILMAIMATMGVTITTALNKGVCIPVG